MGTSSWDSLALLGNMPGTAMAGPLVLAAALCTASAHLDSGVHQYASMYPLRRAKHHTVSQPDSQISYIRDSSGSWTQGVRLPAVDSGSAGARHFDAVLGAETNVPPSQRSPTAQCMATTCASWAGGQCAYIQQPLMPLNNLCRHRRPGCVSRIPCTSSGQSGSLCAQRISQPVSHRLVMKSQRTFDVPEAGIQPSPETFVRRIRRKLKASLPSRLEVKKLLPLGIMFFFILFDYTILRDTKDVLVVTAPEGGAQLIPFLKTYVNLPGAVVFTLLYTRLCNSLPQDKVFYSVITPFLAFFGLFAALIYPNREALVPHLLADQLQSALPAALAPLVAVVRCWPYALFYTMSEMWGSAVIAVLFWGFANEVASVEEAKKYYPLFGLGANVALIFSGQYMRMVSSVRQHLPEGVDPWGVSLDLLMGAVVMGGLVVMGMYHHMQTNVVNDPACIPATRARDMKQRTTLSVGESLKHLAKDAYVRDLAVLVMAYGASMNIIEVTWKSQLQAAFPDPADYSAFMGNFSTTTGVVTLIMMLAGGQIFKRFGWGVAARVTPVMLLGTGAAFFSLSMLGDTPAAHQLEELLGLSPLMLAVLAGGAQNVLSKSCKYSLFDPCKEMAYIPLGPEDKRKGKAAVDVIGNPLGKSTGSFVQQGLIMGTGSLAASTPYLGALLLLLTGSWLVAADSMAKRIDEPQASSDGIEMLHHEQDALPMKELLIRSQVEDGQSALQQRRELVDGDEGKVNFVKQSPTDETAGSIGTTPQRISRM